MANIDFYYPFDSVNSDRQTTAATERRFWAALFSAGVVGANGFAATATSAGVYSIAPGVACIMGAIGGITSAKSITAQPSAGASKYIVLELNTNSAQRKISLEAVNSLTQNTQAQLESGGIYDLPLYQVIGNVGGTYTLVDKREYCTSFDNVQYETMFEEVLTNLSTQFQAAIDAANTETAGLYGAAGRQGFNNPAFAVNQRGASEYSLTSGTIATFDRWLARIGGRTASSAVKFSRVQDGAKSALKIENQTYASGSGAGASCVLQHIENGLRTFCAGNRSFTVSFDAKASESCRVAVEPVQYTSASDAGTALAAQIASVTTSWQRFTFTFTGSVTPTDAQLNDILKVGFFFAWINSTDRFGAAQNAANNVYIANVQINEGSSALPAYIKPIGADLEDCKRYYQRFSGLMLPVSNQNTSTLAYYTAPLPLTCAMASAPTVTATDRNDTANKASIETAGGAWVNNLNFSVSSQAPNTPALIITGSGAAAATRAVFNLVECSAENMTL